MLYYQLQETNMTIEQRRNPAPNSPANSPADRVKFRCRATRPGVSKDLMQNDFPTIDGDLSGPKQSLSLRAGRSGARASARVPDGARHSGGDRITEPRHEDHPHPDARNRL